MNTIFRPYFRSLLFFVLLAVGNPLLAQTETEPNNTLAQANFASFASSTSGSVGCGADNDDYFRLVIPAGTKSLRLITTASMVTGTGAMYVYLYNKYGSQLTNNYLSLNTTSLIDTLDYTCYEGDTFYVRAYDWSGGCKNYSFRVINTAYFTVQNDVENNDAFTAAQGLVFQKDTTGHLASLRYGSTAYVDNEDYYRCVLPPGTKTLRLITASRMVTPGQTGAMYYYLYNKYQQQLTNMYVSLSSTTRIDTLDYDCFEGDTFYVRVYNWSGNCKEYRLRADFTNRFQYKNDAEVNDNFTSAQPLTFQQDTTGHLGSQRFGTTAYTDNEDYYRCVLPPGGTKSLRLITTTRMVQPGQTGALFYYFYNKYQQQLTNVYVSLTATPRTDTLDFTCFEGDTFYVRVYNWSGPCKEYRIKADYNYQYSLQNDAEQNDNFTTAIALPFQKDTTGHLGGQRYLSTASYDNEDYYRCVLPAGTKSLRLITATRAVQPNQTGAMYYYLYNKYQQQLTNMYVTVNNTLRTDTLDFACFEGDTFYVRVYDWSGPCKEYRIRTTHTGDFTLPNDKEPNDALATASPINFKELATGNLAAQLNRNGSAFTDNDDYYRCILPNNGKGVRLVTKARMAQAGQTGAMYFYIYSKTGSQLINRYVSLTENFRSDTIEFNCIQPDTFYIRAYNWSGPCKEYSILTTQSTTGPIAFDISTTRFGNDFSFMNTTRNATSYRWNFGDGKTDTVAAPTHTYGIGLFYPTLSATNVCGTRQFRDTIKVEGVEYYAPKSAGSENNLGIFAIRVFGGGLDSNLSFTLKKNGVVYQPYRLRSPRTTEATVQFDFKKVPPGIYDVEIKFPGGTTYNYPQGFEVYVDTPGFNITTEIVAPARVRTGRMNWYALRVHNHKGRIANGVRAFIVTSRGIQTTISKVIYKKSGKLVIKGSDYDMLTIDPDAYKNLYYQGDFDPNRDSIEVDYDKIYSVFDSLISFDIDSLFGKPYRGTVYPIFIPYINAKSYHTISFQAATPANGDFDMSSYVLPWTVRENPVSGETLDMIHEGGLQAAALAEMSPNPALKAVGKSAGYVDIGSQVAFTEFFDWYYGTNVADDAFYARQGIALTGELAGELVPFGKKADAAIDEAKQAKRQLGRYTEHLNFDEDLILSGIKDPNLAKHMSDRLQFLKNGIEQAGNNLTRAEKEAIINNLKQYAAKKGINLTTKQISDLLLPNEIKNKKVQSLASFDPNQIYGPDGPGPQHFIRRDGDLSYEVTFENVDTALAPAQIVRVNVDLDPSKFDLKQTWLSSVRLAGKLYLFEDQRHEYFRDIDLRPARNMIVRVNAKTDTLSGKLYWEFLTLDPATKNLIDDVDSGFLPPNKIAPEGEGAVTFTTRLLPGVRNMDTVSAFAEIFFDENDPILTNTWTNRVDEGKPVSILNPTVQVQKDSLMVLSLSANDAESGLESYRLYVRVGDSTWLPNTYPLDITGTATLIGKPGEKYAFYIEARDSVGIWENKNRSAEASVTLPKVGPPLYAPGVVVFPNPASGTFTVRAFSADAGTLRINITNISGQLVQSYDGQQPAGAADYDLSTGSLESGVYFVDVRVGGKLLATEKLVILR